MELSKNNEMIKQVLNECGIKFVGFADLDGVNADVRQGLKYGICFGIPLDVFPELGGATEEYYKEYKQINSALRERSLLLESKITELGYTAYSLWRNKQNEDFRTVLPFKTLATRSGLGWIGKSSMLVTREYGNAVRLGGVITDMPFETADPITMPYCGDCRECVEKCPAGAITGNSWKPGCDRNYLVDPFRCKEKVIERGKDMGVSVGSCGICISVCPWTKKYMEMKNKK